MLPENHEVVGVVVGYVFLGLTHLPCVFKVKVSGCTERTKRHCFQCFTHTLFTFVGFIYRTLCFVHNEYLRTRKITNKKQKYANTLHKSHAVPKDTHKTTMGKVCAHLTVGYVTVDYLKMY